VEKKRKDGEESLALMLGYFNIFANAEKKRKDGEESLALMQASTRAYTMVDSDNKLDVRSR